MRIRLHESVRRVSQNKMGIWILKICTIFGSKGFKQTRRNAWNIQRTSLYKKQRDVTAGNIMRKVRLSTHHNTSWPDLTLMPLSTRQTSSMWLMCVSTQQRVNVWILVPPHWLSGLKSALLLITEALTLRVKSRNLLQRRSAGEGVDKWAFALQEPDLWPGTTLTLCVSLWESWFCSAQM